MLGNLDIPAEIDGTLDIAVIGAGPAGMTAAVYSARKKLKTAIISKDVGGQVAWTMGIENYLGFQYITGRELTTKFQEQVREYPIPMVLDEVREIKTEPEGFLLVTTGGRSISSRTVIIATGKRPRELGLPREKDLVGRGVSYCATCDAPFFKGKSVAVCGGGNSAVTAAIELNEIASKVYIVSRNPWRADGILIDKANALEKLEKRIGYDATEIVGDKTAQGLRIKDQKTGKEEMLDVQGIFVEIGLDPNTEFVKGLLKLNKYNEIVVDCMCRTEVPGLYAAGDVTEVHEKQIVVAAGEGAKAALSAYEYLLRKE